MSTKDEYIEKIDTELEVVQARFNEFKAQEKQLKDDSRLEHAKLVAELQRKADATRAKLKELGEADDNAWELLMDGMENTWSDLQSTLENTVTTFKD
jgi:hypothetical protein